MRTLLLSALLAFSSITLPGAAAAGPSCSTDFDTGGCTFTCEVGDKVVVRVWSFNDVYTDRGVAQCGGAVAACEAQSGCDAESLGVALVSMEGSCRLLAADYVGEVIECSAFAVDPTHLHGEVPESSTQRLGGYVATTPSVDTPPMGSASSPAVDAPATCAVEACHETTDVPALGTPPFPKTCDPLGVLCVGPADPIPLVPGTSVPAACTLASAACMPGSTVLPAGAVSTPPVSPVHVLDPRTISAPVVGPLPTPGADVYVNRTEITPGVPSVGYTPVGPFVVGGDGPLPVTICDTPCNVPYTYGTGVVTVTLLAGGEVWSAEVAF